MFLHHLTLLSCHQINHILSPAGRKRQGEFVETTVSTSCRNFSLRLFPLWIIGGAALESLPLPGGKRSGIVCPFSNIRAKAVNFRAQVGTVLACSGFFPKSYSPLIQLCPRTTLQFALMSFLS